MEKGFLWDIVKGVEPLFPFGHGLSYTAFEYSKFTCPPKGSLGDSVKVSIQVKNIGSRAGQEIVQLYVSDKEASLPRPVKELKGFKKIELNPNETQVVEFTLNERELAFYDPYRGKWVVEPGEFEILIGSSSRDIRLSGTCSLI
jgi:beta-glucosidase